MFFFLFFFSVLYPIFLFITEKMSLVEERCIRVIIYWSLETKLGRWKRSWFSFFFCSNSFVKKRGSFVLLWEQRTGFVFSFSLGREWRKTPIRRNVKCSSSPLCSAAAAYICVLHELYSFICHNNTAIWLFRQHTLLLCINIVAISRFEVTC